MPNDAENNKRPRPLAADQRVLVAMIIMAGFVLVVSILSIGAILIFGNREAQAQLSTIFDFGKWAIIALLPTIGTYLNLTRQRNDKHDTNQKIEEVKELTNGVVDKRAEAERQTTVYATYAKILNQIKAGEIEGFSYTPQVPTEGPDKPKGGSGHGHGHGQGGHKKSGGDGDGTPVPPVGMGSSSGSGLANSSWDLGVLAHIPQPLREVYHFIEERKIGT